MSDKAQPADATQESLDVREGVAKILDNADIEDASRGLDMWTRCCLDTADAILAYVRPIIEAEHLEQMKAQGWRKIEPEKLTMIKDTNPYDNADEPEKHRAYKIGAFEQLSHTLRELEIKETHNG